MIPRGGLWAAVALLVGALASVPTAAGAQSDAAPAAMLEGNPRDIQTWGFGPQVPVGGTLIWTNLGAQAHTVTADDGSFDSGPVAAGATASIEFDTPGVFAYACALHPTMKGLVEVSADATSDGPGMAIVEPKPADANSWGFAISVAVGQSVTWANDGVQAHTATASDRSFDTGLVSHAKSATVEFDTPGIVAYICDPHPWMKANVAVGLT